MAAIKEEFHVQQLSEQKCLLYLALKVIQFHAVVFCIMPLYSLVSRYHSTFAWEENIASISKIKVITFQKRVVMEKWV